MSMQKPQELFVHEMSDLLDAEQRIAKMLPLMVQETTNSEMKSALEQHINETRQQISNLEQCFQILGSKPQQTACFAIEGMKKEHDSFLKEQPSADLLMMFNLGGTAKTEQYEIASYTGLIDMAKLVGQQKCVQLLEQNLKQEQAMAHKVTAIAHKHGVQMASQI